MVIAITTAPLKGLFCPFVYFHLNNSLKPKTKYVYWIEQRSNIADKTSQVSADKVGSVHFPWTQLFFKSLCSLFNMSGLIYVTFCPLSFCRPGGWHDVICYIINEINGGQKKPRLRQSFHIKNSAQRSCARLTGVDVDVKAPTLLTGTQPGRDLCCGWRLVLVTRCFTGSLTHSLLSLLQHDVFWFQISVDDPLLVEVG